MTHQPSISEARKRSVDHLQRLITVVVSLGMASAIRNLVTIDSTPNAIDWADWLQFLSFAVTLVPFYHGANRYLDAAYVTGESPAKTCGLMIDFVFLFVQGSLFFVLGTFLGSAHFFYLAYIALLVVDIVWVGVTSLYQEHPNESERQFSYRAWAAVNAVALILVFIVLFTQLLVGAPKHILLAMLALSRTVMDYKLSFPVYFPAPGPAIEDKGD